MTGFGFNTCKHGSFFIRPKVERNGAVLNGGMKAATIQPISVKVVHCGFLGWGVVQVYQVVHCVSTVLFQIIIIIVSIIIISIIIISIISIIIIIIIISIISKNFVSFSK